MQRCLSSLKPAILCYFLLFFLVPCYLAVEGQDRAASLFLEATSNIADDKAGGGPAMKTNQLRLTFQSSFIPPDFFNQQHIETNPSIFRAPAIKIRNGIQSLGTLKSVSIKLFDISHPRIQDLAFYVTAPEHDNTNNYALLSYGCGRGCGLNPQLNQPPTPPAEESSPTITFSETASASTTDWSRICSQSAPSTPLEAIELRTGICTDQPLPPLPAPYSSVAGYQSLDSFSEQPFAGEWNLWIMDTRSSLEEGGNPSDSSSLQSTNQVAARLSSWSIDLLLEEVYTEEPIALAINGSATTSGSNPVPVLPIIGCSSIGYFSSPDTVMAFCTDSPAAILQPTASASNDGYAVQFDYFDELDANGNLVKTTAVPQSGYAASIPSADVFVYSRKVNTSTIIITWTYYQYPTTLSFAGTTFTTFGDSTVLQLNITDWPFDPSSAFLKLSFSLLPYDSSFGSPAVDTTNPSLTECSYQGNGFEGRINLIPFVVADGVVKPATLQLNGTTVSAVFPAFTSTLLWDPDFSVVVSTSNSGGDGSTDDWVIAVAVVVPIVVLTAIFILVGILVVTILTRRRFRRSFESATKNSQ